MNVPLTYAQLSALPNFDSRTERVKWELRALGVTRVGMLKFASRYLPHIIHDDERLGGVVYGQAKQGSVMLVATDRRIIFLNKKPFLLEQDEITYDVVSGVSYNHAGFGTTVILRTRIKDFSIRTFNQLAAENFVEYIELRCLENTGIKEIK